MQLESIIGLEIHVQLKTASKMFCSCANIFGDVPANSAVCPICLGYPGTLPVPNKQAIDWTRLAGAALNCQLATHSKFDRKSYFYPDLPKGYQISQYDQPFCHSGQLTFEAEGKQATIMIERIHLEEDAAKNTHPEKADYTLIDFNRAGTPLIEIVTAPDFRTPQQAKIFLQELQAIVRALGISDADMEKGQLRCDANISLRPVGESKLYSKTEIKNLNSFRNVEAALKYEIDRQTKLWQQGKHPQQTTRGWDVDTGKTTPQRTKEAAADYRYFPEPDIPPFVFTAQENEAVKKRVPELPAQRRQRFMRQYGLNWEQAQLLVESKEIGYFFEDVVSEIKQLDKEQVAVLPAEVPKLVQMSINIIAKHIRPLMMKENLHYQNLRITAENFAEVVVLIHQGRLSQAALPQVVGEMQRTGGDPDPIIQNLGLEQISGDDQLNQYIDQVIAGNQDIVAKIKTGKASALQFLVGQVMAKSRGAANPQKVRQLLEKKIL